MNLDLMCEHTFDDQRALIAEAARRRLGRSSAPRSTARTRWRAGLALQLRRVADRLEPQPPARQLGVLRAVAHREIDVEQALVLFRLER